METGSAVAVGAAVTVVRGRRGLKVGRAARARRLRRGASDILGVRRVKERGGRRMKIKELLEEGIRRSGGGEIFCRENNILVGHLALWVDFP